MSCLHHVLLPRRARKTSILESKSARLEKEERSVEVFLSRMHECNILILGSSRVDETKVKFVYIVIENETLSILLGNDVNTCKFYVSKKMKHKVEVRKEPPLPEELGSIDSVGDASPVESGIFTL